MKIKQINNTLRLHRLVDIKAVTQDQDKPNTLYIEGYASFYRNDIGMKEVDRDREIVNVDGLDIQAYQKNPVLLWNHCWDEVRGKVVSITKDQNGLYVKAEMQRLTGKEADFENVLYGNVKSFSIGFIPYEYEYLDDAVEITKSEMIELSIAPVQSNRSALFQVVGTKSLAVDNTALKTLLNIEDKKDNKMEINKKDSGTPDVPVTPAEPTPVTTTVTETKPAETAPTTPVVPEVKVEVKNDLDVTELAKQIAAASAEAERIAKEEAERIAKEEAERIAKEEAERIAKEEQKFIDALALINAKKDEILSLRTFDELNANAEELNKFIEPITSASEAIINKVTELSKEAVGVTNTPNGDEA